MAAGSAPERPPIYEGSRIPSPIPSVLQPPEELRASDDILDGQLRAEPPVDPRRAAPGRRPRRRGRRRPRRRRRLPPHRLREEHGAEDVVEGDHVPAADRLPRVPGQRARLRARDREAARASRCRRRRRGCACSSRAEPDPLAPRLARHAALELGAISMFWYCFRERDQILDLFELVDRRPDAHALLPGRRPRRGHPARLLRRVPQVRRADAEGDRRLRDAARPEPDLARADAGPRPPLAPTTRSRSASPARCCARPASTGTSAAAEPYLAYDEVDFDVPVYHERRRLRPLPRADGRDARVGADHRPVPRPLEGMAGGRGSPTTARSCCRRARSCTPRWSR